MSARLGAAVAALAAGLALALIWTLAQPDRYRADARIAVRPGSDEDVAAVEAMAKSDVLAQNVAQTLHIAAPRVTAHAGRGGVLTVSASAASPERARQVDAEAVVVLAQRVAQRFPSSKRVTLTVLDPAHPAERTSPNPWRNFSIGAVVGLALAIAALAAFARRPLGRRFAGNLDGRRERRLEARVASVTQREAALARRAGELAVRERRLREREEQSGPAPDHEEPAEPQAVAAPEPEPVAAAAPAPLQPAAGLREGGWSIDTLEQLVDERRGSFPAEAEEWETYLFLLREHANARGELPQSFDALIADVFADAVR